MSVEMGMVRDFARFVSVRYCTFKGKKYSAGEN